MGPGRTKLYIRYHGVTRTPDELTDIIGCARSTIVANWNRFEKNHYLFEKWADEYKKTLKNCPVCGEKTYAKVMCSFCTEKSTRAKTRPNLVNTKLDSRPPNCNFKCARYMTDDCPGINLMDVRPKYRPTSECHMPVVEATREQVRGRVLSKVR